MIKSPISGKDNPEVRVFLILSFTRTIILYLLLLFAVRLMGKRQVGQMEPSEFVVTMLVANLASIPMEDADTPIYIGMIPILTVLGAELVLSSISLWSVRLRKLLCGKPVILVENGRILQQNLRATRITLDELIGHLREKDVLDVRTVQYAILETNGNLSVFPYPAEAPASAKEAGIHPKKQYLPITIIEDGHLFRDNLKLSGKDEAWVQRILGEYRSCIAATWLLSVDQGGNVIWQGKEKEA